MDTHHSTYISNTYDKYLKQMLEAYDETFKNVRDIKISSIQPLYSRLEKLVQETYDSRMLQLKAIFEKESSLVNKQTHELIKSKKKSFSETVHDKEELQRIIKKIGKESVSYAANEIVKLEDLLKLKQKSIKQIVDNCLAKLKDYKEKQANIYKTECFQKLSEKKIELEKRYIHVRKLNTEADLNNNSLLQTEFSKSTSQLNGYDANYKNDDSTLKVNDIRNRNSSSQNEITRL